MAHGEQRVFFETVRKHFPEYFVDTRVLEVGSLNINGTLRDFFSTDTYIGCDVGEGPCVDIVCGGQELTYPDDEFDVTVSAECFEHNPYWIETFANMLRMTRPGGLIVFSCAGMGRPEHGTARTDVGSSPLTAGLGWDYYRNLSPYIFAEEARGSLLAFYTGGGRGAFFENEHSCDLYFVGTVGTKHEQFNDFIADIREWLAK